jgi:hypothetical protein
LRTLNKIELKRVTFGYCLFWNSVDNVSLS